MKFGHQLKQVLQEEFPPAWIDQAIGYQQLKKCLHRLEKELSSFGLTPETLRQLLQEVEDHNTRAESELASQTEALAREEQIEKPFEYILTPEARAEQDLRDAANSDEKAPENTFHPKLLFTVDVATGEPLSANLSPETRSKLHQLALENGITNVRVTEVTELDEAAASEASDEDPQRSSSNSSSGTTTSPRELRMIEVPLTSDSEFFSMLTTQLSGIAELQSVEEKRLHTVIIQISQKINKIIEANPGKKRDIRDVVRWRRILNYYTDCNVFFETKPSMRVVAHTVTEAEKQLLQFTNMLNKEKLTNFKSEDSEASVNMFLELNQDLLQTLKFQEINNTAMYKILKKFDKRTALGVKATFPNKVHIPVFTDAVAKAVCYQVNKDVVETVPRLSDYSCAICSDIHWRPVRLECDHVFCIRCMIVMQRNKQSRCPLCRKEGILALHDADLDDEMKKFLEKWFPDEVTRKQKENEFLAGVDQYGEAYKAKCIVM
ncbi:uncharacterized protein BDZ99DRAFT_436449 [Mytilinidion resinicola]|uniref:RING-14 protein n=1 Tax=Mytilinidion resinicola TaxID=574789 RepID=A0A6A6YYH9_9PEZI|nr:uncharacterized protein BDZ99DRAFT_436449 [Mytilinidion resinicola]KAF2813881.1 hypothetical protein BDZ99DRAFT_436449 [Mytilinidion resinicola]